MSNAHEFKLGPLDQILAEMSPEERHQLIMDYDELERTSRLGDCLLRDTAERVYESMHGRRSFDPTFMMMIGLSAHKLNSIDAIRAQRDVALSDEMAKSRELVSAISALPTIREAALSNAAESGLEASTAEEMEDALETYLFDGRNDLNETQAGTLDEYIRQAREILGVPETTPEEELAKLAPENDVRP